MDIKWLEAEFPDLSEFRALAPSGQKEVFAAVHRAEGPVVLKVYKPGANPERIGREINTPLKVRSTRVPKVAELGTTKAPFGNIIWVREQKIEGRSLRDELGAKGKLDAKVVIRIGLHVLEVLADAERAEVVHRDIKPGNVIIAPDGSAWVIDFGFARHLGLESVTDTAAKGGPCTPGYAPVEQFTNQKKEIDGRADLFAAGVTLYECVEGVNPFLAGARSPNEIFDRVMNTRLPRIASTGVPEQFVDLVEAMTRAKPEHRLPRASEAFDWVKEIAAAESVVA